MKFVAAILLAWAGLFSAWASADQNHSELDSLFSALLKAESNYQAQVLEGEIWQAWLEAPNQSAADILSQLTAAMSVGQHALALQFANQLVDIEPEFAEAWNKRATLHYLLGNHGLSVADIKETLALEPRHFGALSGLGLIFMSSENYEAALDAFNQVLALNPNSHNAKDGIARAQSMIGEDI